jgi:nucleotide-binding universal stress UspA family protein
MKERAMYRTLLVPLDGSRLGEHALPLAASIARRAGAALHLVRVHPPSPVGEGIAAFATEKAAWALAKSYLDEVAGRLEAGTGVSATTRVLDGPVAATLHEYATSQIADLVVMSTHGRGPLSRFWLGSVADQLAHCLPMPLLLVRPHDAPLDLAREPALRRLLVGLDGSPRAEAVLGPALGLARLTGATVALLRVVLPPPVYGMDLPPYAAAGAGADLTILEELRHEAEAYLTRVADRLRGEGHAVEARVAVHTHAATALLEEPAQTGCDLIALATHGRRGLPRLFLGSVADKVVRGAEVPVLLHRSLEGTP